MAAPSQAATLASPIDSRQTGPTSVAAATLPTPGASSTLRRSSLDERHAYGHAPYASATPYHSATHAYDEHSHPNYHPASYPQSSPKTSPKDANTNNTGNGNANANSPSNPPTPTPDAGNAPSSNRRLAHILSEQKRRENINSGFEDLKNVVPGCRGSADSKAVILRKAVHYIHSLQTELANIRHNVASSGPSSTAYMHTSSYPHHVSPPSHHLHSHPHSHSHHQQPPLAPPPPPHHPYPQHPSQHPPQHAYMRYQETPSAIPAKRTHEEDQYGRSSQQDWNARTSHSHYAPPPGQYYDQQSYQPVPPPPPTIQLAPLVGHTKADAADEPTHKREPSDV